MSDVLTTVCLLLYNETTGEGPSGIDCKEYLESVDTILKLDRYMKAAGRLLFMWCFFIIVALITGRIIEGIYYIIFKPSKTRRTQQSRKVNPADNKV